MANLAEVSQNRPQSHVGGNCVCVQQEQEINERSLYSTAAMPKLVPLSQILNFPSLFCMIDGLKFRGKYIVGAINDTFWQEICSQNMCYIRVFVSVFACVQFGPFWVRSLACV